MSISTSVLEDLLRAQPRLRPQIYFKPSLTALSHAMEDQVLAGGDRPLVIANFQQERFYRQEAHRYRRIAEKTPQVYVLAAPETEFRSASDSYEMVAFVPTDELSREWHLIVVGPQYASCLACREREAFAPDNDPTRRLAMDQSRRFEGIWTFNREVSCTAARLLLDRVLAYRPELAAKIAEARSQLLIPAPSGFQNVDPGPFAERLVTYLQASQYKLLKAYSSIATQERRERLVNSITDAIRRSLNPDEIFQVAVRELGAALQTCRCLIYRCKESDTAATIQHEFLGNQNPPSLAGQTWPLQTNPLFEEIVQQQAPVTVTDARSDPRLVKTEAIASLHRQWEICSRLLVPVLYQGRLLGMVELHYCGNNVHAWQPDEVQLVEAIATQVGVALIQAEAYANLEDLNQQLEALDLTTRNLIAIAGHELRTPLSTIQVCLESLASEPDMPLELRQVMLNTALDDAERLRKLIQDFLALSRLESGRVEWNPEPLPLQECIDLALSSVRTHQASRQLPQIIADLPAALPLVQADGEWLVEVLAKLIDNACKFTQPDGKVTIAACRRGDRAIEVTVKDTGRGIEPNRLEAIFNRFYQEEGALRRTAGGTGLGLAICRQVVTNWGGQIWAESAGKDRGSQFRFTLPVVCPAGKNPNAQSPMPKGNSLPVEDSLKPKTRRSKRRATLG